MSMWCIVFVKLKAEQCKGLKRISFGLFLQVRPVWDNDVGPQHVWESASCPRSLDKIICSLGMFAL